MRRVRKSSHSHRGLRPRILSAARAAAGALLAALLLAALGACSASHASASAAASARAGARGVPAASPEGQAWYQLEAGMFTPVAAPTAAPSTARRPWTVQSRVADLARVNGTLYCAVNSWGLAALKRDALGTPSFSYYFDSLIFGHRTITTLVPRGGTVAVHLYFNALLNDTRLADLPLSGICLVSFLPASSDYTFLIPPFQRKNPDWEAVGFAPSSENQFDFEWKFTDSSETRFAYTHYDADRQEEKPERRDSYVAALAVSSLSGKDVPQDLAAFFAACRDATAGLSRGAFFQFILRSDGAVRRIYRSGVEESDSAVVIPVFQEPGVRCALLPGGQVLYAPVGGTARLIALPPLAAGFRYTDLAKAGDSLVVPWEESTFTDVGSAGILLLKIKP